MRVFLGLCLVLGATFTVTIAGNNVPSTQPPGAECPVCFCSWTGCKWTPVEPSCGQCECSEYMCSLYLKPPEGAFPKECPWYGCPSEMPGPPPATDSYGNTEAPWDGPCPVCNCYWTSSEWLPVKEKIGYCGCNYAMCKSYLQPPKPGQPTECPWYGCPSGMEGPTESPTTIEIPVNTEEPPCPGCSCYWTSTEWLPVEVREGKCPCIKENCKYLKPPKAGEPLRCPDYGCPSGMEGPTDSPSTFQPTEVTVSSTFITGSPYDCPVCNCYWSVDRWLPEEVRVGKCGCNLEMCKFWLQPLKAGEPTVCPWYGCPSGMPGPPSSP